MKAMVLDQPGDIAGSPLSLRDMPDPEPGPGEVRVRVRCCACCRTDLHVIEGDLPPHKRPIIVGHQVVGTVEKLGPACRRFETGDRIGIAWLRHTCGQCEYCRRGAENLRDRSLYTGYDGDGGYAELAVVSEDYAYSIPDTFDDVHAAPLLCAGIIGYRSLKRSQLPPGGRLAMYGFGSSCDIVLELVRARGSEVYVVTRGASHRELARKMGAAWVGADAREMPQKTHSAIMFAPAGELVPPRWPTWRRGERSRSPGSTCPPFPRWIIRPIFSLRRMCTR